MNTRVLKARNASRPRSDIPAIIKLTGKPGRRGTKPLTVNFNVSVPQGHTATPSVTPEATVSMPQVVARQAAVDVPKAVAWSNLLAAQAACLLLLAATFFMPHQAGTSGWWSGLKAGSLAFAMPGTLKIFEISAGLFGFVVIPFLRGEERGRLMLSIGLGVTLLLTAAMLEQNLIGIYLVVLPIAGLLSLAALYAILQARTLSPHWENLGMWQLVASLGVIVMWVLPSLQSASDPFFGQIFASMGGVMFRGVFAFGGLCALLSGVVAVAESQGKFSLGLNRIARVLTGTAFVAISAVGAAAALSVSQVLAGPAMTKGWFGVGVIWLFLLITASVILIGAGLTQQFCRAAINGYDERPTTATPILATIQL